MRLSQTTGLLNDKQKKKDILARKPHAHSLSRSRILVFCFVLFCIFPSVQVEAVQPVQKRALCIQTAGCYGQSGNGGQGTDRGRGSRPVDSHHSHRGELSSAERLVGTQLR